MAKEILAGSTNQTIDVFIQDSSSTVGGGLAGLTFETASLTCYYRIGATGSWTALTLATQTIGGAHSDGGFVEGDATNAPGMYRLDLSDAMVATAGTTKIYLQGAANMAPTVVEIEVVAVNKFDAVRGGMSALPDAAADAAGGLVISDLGGFNIDAITPSLNTISAIAIDVAGLDGDAMRGTDGAYTGGNITGNLSGSVGSVTGAVGSVTAEVDANVTKVAGAAVAGVNDFKASVAGLATEANVDAVGVAVLARAVPGDAMALTALAITAIDTELSATHGAGSWESAGVAAGANIVVITVNDALGFPVPSTSVVVRNNSDNATIGFYVTNNNGQITANLDNSPAGLPYKVRLGKVGLMFTIPENLTVLGDTNQTYTGTVVDPGVPVAGLQTLSGNIKLLTGDAEPNATVRAVIASMPQHVDVSVLSNVVSEAETDSNGNFSLYLIKGASVTLYISQDVNGRRFWQKTITVTDDNTRNIVEY